MGMKEGGREREGCVWCVAWLHRHNHGSTLGCGGKQRNRAPARRTGDTPHRQAHTRGWSRAHPARLRPAHARAGPG